MRLIEERLNAGDLLSSWTGFKPVIKVSHFFWSPGSKLQKSFLGFLRSLLYQILESQPALTERCISPSKWRVALTGSTSSCLIEWGSSELVRAIFAAIDLKIVDVFLLVDGLDVS